MRWKNPEVYEEAGCTEKQNHTACSKTAMRQTNNLDW